MPTLELPSALDSPALVAGDRAMHPALNRNLFLVKEHVGMFKAANNFDIYDPESGELLLLCREVSPSASKPASDGR